MDILIETTHIILNFRDKGLKSAFIFDTLNYLMFEKYLDMQVKVYQLFRLI